MISTSQYKTILLNTRAVFSNLSVSYRGSVSSGQLDLPGTRQIAAAEYRANFDLLIQLVNKVREFLNSTTKLSDNIMPYTEHPTMDEPSGPMWRYIDLSKLFWMLEVEKLHFHRTGDFSDPLEGRVPKAAIDLSKRTLKKHGVDDETIGEMDFKESIIRQSIEARATTFVNSWYARNVESAAMWEKHRNQGNAVCIRSSVSNFRKAIENTSKEIYLSKIIYIPHSKCFEEFDENEQENYLKLRNRTPLGNMLLPVLSKRNEFSHESEIRAITYDGDPFGEIVDNRQLGYGDLERLAEDYKNISVNVNKLIDEIIIGPSTPTWVWEAIESYIKKSDLDITVTDSKLSRHSFDLTGESITTFDKQEDR
jgi:hypothetical protein